MITAKILPNMNSKDLRSLNKNENLVSSTFYKIIKLVEVLEKDLKITKCITEKSTAEYDIIIARYMGNKIKKMDKSKPIYEFHYCTLNSGWFLSRYTHNDISFDPEYVTGPNSIGLKPMEEITNVTGLSQIFFTPVVNFYLTE